MSVAPTPIIQVDEENATPSNSVCQSAEPMFPPVKGAEPAIEKTKTENA